MKVVGGKIAECSDEELREFWSSRLVDTGITYEQYKIGCMANGTKIVDPVPEPAEYVPICKMFRSRRCYNECNWFGVCDDFEREEQFYERLNQ